MQFELNLKQRFVTMLITITICIIIAIIIGPHIYWQTMLIMFLWYSLTGDRPSFIYAICRTLPRDFQAAVKFAKLNIILKKWEHTNMTVAKIFEKVVKKYPNKIAFIMDDSKLTFAEADDFCNKVANYFKENNFQQGDIIALVMETRPEYTCFWLGLSKLGITTALVNSNLRKDTLVHSIRTANAKAIIFGVELADALNDIRDNEYVKKLPIFYFSDKNQRTVINTKLPEDSIDLFKELQNVSNKPPHDEMENVNPREKMVYIYTSGTTGLPKAAVITNLRYMFMACACNNMLSVRNDDIIYNALPLYHTAGGIIGVGNVLLNGVTMALRTKFSASNFWLDCIRYNATVAQYIGEICRYVLAVPSKPHDTQHKVRLMFGNGLRPQIWPQFVQRFNIEQIGEVYGSTEGNSNLINIDSAVGAVGFIPRFAKALYPVTLVKCDEDTGNPIRNSNGYCTECQPGEPGVFVGKINPKIAVNAFSGYADKAASEKKILKNVFRNGDFYFNSGDILVMDILGYFYFKDRMGDTFRWRGENVATSEVEAVISNVAVLHDCVVYGVDIPHVEGKAGMAAIVDPDNELNMESLSAGIKGSLPPFARPLFIRVLAEMPMTGTFKLKKRELQLQGFQLGIVEDPIFFLHNDGIYRRFTEKDYDDVKNGRARL